MTDGRLVRMGSLNGHKLSTNCFIDLILPILRTLWIIKCELR